MEGGRGGSDRRGCKLNWSFFSGFFFFLLFLFSLYFSARKNRKQTNKKRNAPPPLSSHFVELIAPSLFLPVFFILSFSFLYQGRVFLSLQPTLPLFFSLYEYLTFRQTADCSSGFVRSCSAERRINAPRRERCPRTHTHIYLRGGECAAKVESIPWKAPSIIWFAQKLTCFVAAEVFFCQMLALSHLPPPFSSDAFIVQCCSSVLHNSLPASSEQQWPLRTPASFKPHICVCDLME